MNKDGQTLADIIAAYMQETIPKVEGPMNLQEKVVEYAAWDALATELENAKKEAEAHRSTIETSVMENFTNEGINSTRVAGLGTFSMASMNRASILADKKEAAIAAFKKFYPEMVQETVNAQTLSGFVNNSLKNGTPIEPEVMSQLSVFKKTYLSWKK